MKDNTLEKFSKKLVINNTFIDKKSNKKNNIKDIQKMTQISKVSGYKIENNKKKAIEGELLYREIDIKKILCSIKGKGYYFERVIYLLWFGNLPNEQEFSDFLTLFNYKNQSLKEIKLLDNTLINKLQIGILNLYETENNSIKPHDLLLDSIKIISAIPDLILQFFLGKEYDIDKSIELKKKRVSISEYMLSMMKKDYSKEELEIFDISLVLHAEHGAGNNSTFSVRNVSSVYTDTYSAICVGINSLKGIRHGEACVCVKKMVDEIEQKNNSENVFEIEKYLEKILDKKAFDGLGLIYGIGHAVYTTSDPRAIILKKEIKRLKNRSRERLQLYENIEKIGIDVLKKRKGNQDAMCVNIDFYTSLLYEILEIDESVFTPLFVLARAPSWSIHRIEQILNNKEIYRPQI